MLYQPFFTSTQSTGCLNILSFLCSFYVISLFLHALCFKPDTLNMVLLGSTTRLQQGLYFFQVSYQHNHDNLLSYILMLFRLDTLLIYPNPYHIIRQPFEHAIIFCTSKPMGQTTSFDLYVVAGNLLPSKSILFMIFNRSLKPLLNIPFATF